MSTEKSQIERLLDVVVFAPAGLVQSAAEEFEKLAAKGRHRVEGQVHTARLVGQFAVQTARSEAHKLLDATLTKLSGAQAQPGGFRPRSDGGGGEVDGAAHEDSTPRHDGWAAPEGHEVSAVAANGASPAADLAIPGYDSLSASQVVQRLDGLSRDELEDVKGHELSNRHRRTILSRVDQLLSGADQEHP
jgi:hypothetical protein